MFLLRFVGCFFQERLYGYATNSSSNASVSDADLQVGVRKMAAGCKFAK